MLIVSEKMILRWRYMVLVVLVVGSLAQDHPGLVEKDSDQDLLAEATILGAQAQKREAGLSNSYGEPLPADVYGPPKDIGNNLISDISLPAPIYGVPEFQNTPTGAYGPPSPVFPNQNYEGPPPPPSKPKLGYGPPKPVYGPPKHSYGPPKQTYGPPKKLYGPPKHGLPKLTYGAPFKPPKLSFPKPVYGVPNSIYGPPKQKYGPPKPVYGLPNATPLLPEVPTLPDLPSINVHQNIPIGSDFGNVNVNVGSNIGFDLPAPIYGTPFLSLPHDMKPNFPLPTETYGPPGQPLGPAGANDQILIQDLGNFHYGPPQPDPNPRPPHPGIPAPPTPPHVLYDGWKPIPGVSKPFGDNEYQHIENQYGPPPPPPPKLNFDLNFDGLTLPNLNPPPQFSGAQINTGYSNVKHDIHHDALANIDLNAIVGGDSNHIDQSKTVFEAHYTEPTVPTGNLIFQSGSSSQFNRPADSYGAPPLESLSNGPYPQSFRSHGAKELPHLSVGHAITAGNHYGPPKQQSSNLPIPYGTFSGGGHSIHTGGSTPRHPIKFREPVPDGLIQQIGHISHHKDLHPNNDHLIQGPAYLPPPIRDAKDVNQHSGNHGLNSISLSIEPSNLYSLPHAGNPINFQNHGQSQPSNLYGSPIDSYSVPLLTVGDHTASGSNTNAVTATIDGTILANLSNLDAAAILKHCPYHEEILKAARTGGKISPELASSYIASLSSLGTAFQKNHQFLNGLNTPLSGNEFYNNKDLSTASQSLVQTVLAGKDYKKELNKGSIVKGKSVKQEQNYDQDDLQLVSQQIFQTSEKIKNLSDETKELQQKIVSSNKNIKGKYSKDISNGKFGGYSVQISPSDGKSNQPSIPHDQLLSEGLLQSILHAIEQPSQAPGQIINDGQQNNYHNINQFTSQSNQGINFGPSSMLDIRNLGSGGIDLPAGYEPVDRTKDKRQEGDQDLQASNKDLRLLLNNEIIQKNKESHTDCDLRADNSIRHVVVVPPPGLGAAETKPVDEVEDNDVAIYFDEPSTNSKEKVEPVTEITVATSISEEIEDTKEEVGFGDKIDKKQS